MCISAENQSSNGEESTGNRRTTKNFKSISNEEKSIPIENLNCNYSIKSKSDEADNNDNYIVPEVNNNGIEIEKNDLFTFMTIDNNNPSQRVYIDLLSLNQIFHQY